MNCDAIKERLVDYLYGELPADERRAFDAHLEGCESCRGEVEALGSTLRVARTAVRSTLDEEPPAHVRSAVMAAAQAALAGAGVSAASAGVTATSAGVRATSAGVTAAAGASTVPSEGARTETRDRATDPSATPPVGERLRAWWRRPWLIPAFAAATAMVFFVFVRQAVPPGPSTSPPSIGELQGPGPGSRLERAVGNQLDELPPGSVVEPEARPATGAAPAPVAAQPYPAPVAAKQMPARSLGEGKRRLSATSKGGGAARESHESDAKAEKRADVRARPSYAAPPPVQYRRMQGADDDTLGGLEVGHGPAGVLGVRGGRGTSATSDVRSAPVERVAPLAKSAAPAETTRSAAAPAHASKKAKGAQEGKAFDDAAELFAPPAAPAPSKPPQEPAADRAAESEAAGAVALERAKTTAASNDTASFAELVKRAERSFAAGKWAESAGAYRALLRRFPEHKNVPVWKGRVRACEEALAR